MSLDQFDVSESKPALSGVVELDHLDWPEVRIWADYTELVWDNVSIRFKSGRAGEENARAFSLYLVAVQQHILEVLNTSGAGK